MNTLKTRKHQIINITKCILYTSVSGLFVGSVVSIFNYLAKLISENSEKVYSFINNNLAYLPLLILGLILLSLIMSFIQKKVPETKGSGIPQVKGAIKGLLTFKWLRVLLATFFNSMISFFVGLSLGSEGPSVQLGSTAAVGAGKLLGSNPHWDRYLIRGGAAAGMATAFNAPITGIIFSIEEAHDHFTPLILIATLCSVMSAMVISNLINTALGVESLLFQMNIHYSISINEIHYHILLGIVVGVSGIIFNFLLIQSKKITDKIKVPDWVKLAFAFLVIGITNVFFFKAAGSGHGLILDISSDRFAWQTLLLLLFVKALFTILSFDSGATGGMFFPMLTIGALIGGLMAEGFLQMGMNKDAYNTIIICSMAAFLGAVSRTPLTAILAIIETTVFRSGFIAPVFTVCIAFIIIELSQSTALYDHLLKRYITRLNEKKTRQTITTNITVEEHSFVDGKYIRDILWPQDSFIVYLIRNKTQIPVQGHTQIQAGDVLAVQATTYNPTEITEIITDLCTRKNTRSVITKLFNKKKKPNNE